MSLFIHHRTKKVPLYITRPSRLLSPNESTVTVSSESPYIFLSIELSLVDVYHGKTRGLHDLGPLSNFSFSEVSSLFRIPCGTLYGIAWRWIRHSVSSLMVISGDPSQAGKANPCSVSTFMARMGVYSSKYQVLSFP